MYKFTLEPVLNHRKYIEEILQRELGVYEKLLNDERKKLRAYKRVKIRFTQELREKQRDGISISENLLYSQFLDRILEDVDKQTEKVWAMEGEFDQKRDGLINAVKNRKTLDKLKEREVKTHDQELAKNERDFLNEVAIARFSRSM